MLESRPETKLLDLEPATQTFHDDVIAGLGGAPKTLPCKYFYDQRGSRLFDQICQLDEYYLTRTELEIMRTYAAEMCAGIGSGVMLVEYGSGSSTKTRLILDHLEAPAAYVPVDISRSHLHRSADALSRLYPDVEVLPVCADFTTPFHLPQPRIRPTHHAVYFPGSTIGNFQPEAARRILANIATLCGRGGGLLVGIDLQKDHRTLEAAYNDAAGVTAAFNLNLLERIKLELQGDVDIEQFSHRAVYDAERGRVEISVVSQCEQVMTVGDRSFKLESGEAIRTEFSHKYTIDGFAEMASGVGLTLRRHWTDTAGMFAVLHLVIVD